MADDVVDRVQMFLAKNAAESVVECSRFHHLAYGRRGDVEVQHLAVEVGHMSVESLVPNALPIQDKHGGVGVFVFWGHQRTHSVEVHLDQLFDTVVSQNYALRQVRVFSLEGIARGEVCLFVCLFVCCFII